MKKIDYMKFVEIWEDGISVREMSVMFNISPRTVYKIVYSLRRNGIDLSGRQNQPRRMPKREIVNLSLRVDELKRMKEKIGQEYVVVRKSELMNLKTGVLR